MRIGKKLLSLLLALCLLAAAVPMAFTEDVVTPPTDGDTVVAEPVDEAVEEAPDLALPEPDAPEARTDDPEAVVPEYHEALNAGSSLGDATPVEFGPTYSGMISQDNTADFYVFALPSSGRVTFSATAKIEYVSYYLYNAAGTELWHDTPHWNATTRESVFTPAFDLIGGTYYIAVKKYNSYTGNYSFNLAFVSANETYAETAGQMNNTLETASLAALGSSYIGQIAFNDSTDFYVFTIPSPGRLTFSATAKIEYVSYYLYNAAGTELWHDTPRWNATTRESVFTPAFDLIGGTYYIAVKKSNSYTGNYSFNLAFVSANETYAETAGQMNNTLETASLAALGSSYIGQIAFNDSTDFYVFTIPSSGRLTFSSTAKIEYVSYYLYNAAGTELWHDTPHWNATTRESVFTPAFDLIGGTYYIAVKKSNSYTGNYSFNLAFVSANETYAETAGQMNNTIETASLAALGTPYIGQIAFNDSTDFYIFATPSSSRLNFYATAKIEYVSYYLYNAAGSELWHDTPHWNTTTRESVINRAFDLDGGTYYIAIKKSNSYTGNYSIQIDDASAPTPTPVITPTPTPVITPTPTPVITPTPTPVITPTPTPIARIGIGSCTVAGIASRVYTGKAIKPAPAVKYKGKALVRGTDYTLSYKNNVKIGRASVIVKGIGKYTGAVTRYFSIIPKSVSLSRLTAGKRSLVAQWKKGSNITGYQLEYSSRQDFGIYRIITVANTSTFRYVIRGLAAKMTYYVRVRTYKKVNGKAYFSAWSKARAKRTK